MSKLSFIEQKIQGIPQGKKRVINGWWNGEPIWRYENEVETLEREGIKEEVANLFIALNEQ